MTHARLVVVVAPIILSVLLRDGAAADRDGASLAAHTATKRALGADIDAGGRANPGVPAERARARRERRGTRAASKRAASERATALTARQACERPLRRQRPQ